MAPKVADKERRTNKKRTTLARQAGILFPPRRAIRKMKKIARQRKMRITAGIYACAVAEYLTAEVLDLAGRLTRLCKKVIITPAFIQRAVRFDEDMDTVFKDVIIPGGGVLQRIHPKLLTKKT